MEEVEFELPGEGTVGQTWLGPGQTRSWSDLDHLCSRSSVPPLCSCLLVFPAWQSLCLQPSGPPFSGAPQPDEWCLHLTPSSLRLALKRHLLHFELCLGQLLDCLSPQLDGEFFRTGAIFSFHFVLHIS